MSHKRLCFSLIILATIALSPTLQAASNDDPVSIRLQKAMDKNCDRTPEELSKVQSGHCIIYRIEVQNNSDSMIQRTEVSALIPKHTVLYSPLEVIEGNAIVSSDITRNLKQAGTITTKVGGIGAGHKVILQYSVKVL